MKITTDAATAMESDCECEFVNPLGPDSDLRYCAVHRAAPKLAAATAMESDCECEFVNPLGPDSDLRYCAVHRAAPKLAADRDALLAEAR